MKILIVEDQAPVARMLTAALTRWGHETRTAETGETAMELLAKEMFDLILLDIYLPDAMGYDLIPRMKSGWSGMEIITMTGQSTRELEKKIRSQGILYYMVKPVSMAELRTLIDHLGSKGSKRGIPSADITAT